LSVFSNVSEYLAIDADKKADFNFDYQDVIASFTIVFGSALFLPLIFFCSLLCAGIEFSLQNLSNFNDQIFCSQVTDILICFW
jgi:hypothetical protein